MTSARWLLLAHQLPTQPSNARVKTWRRLQQVGAVPTRNSVYVLPNTDQCREDFEWIRSEIVALKGEATVFAADALNADGDGAIVAAFQRSRDADYRAFTVEAERLRSSARRKAGSASGQDTWARAVGALRARFTEIEGIDFFAATARQRAAEVLATLERLVAARGHARTSDAHRRLSPADFHDRRWVTRPRPGVDRMASAWLIHRFIDPNAVFAFVAEPGESDVAFDMYVGEFGHHGASCTFETLADRFGLVHAAVARIGQIVHDLDMKETRYAAPETPAVGRLVEGLRQLHEDDRVLLEQGMAMFEALARSFESTDGPPASTRPTRARTPGRRRRASR